MPFTRCFAAALRAGAKGAGASVAIQKTERVRRWLAPHELGYRFRFTFSAGGSKVAGRVGFYAFARGRAFGGVAVMSLGRPLQPISPALERTLAATVADRMRR
jgi:hypothetical protein